jgi:cation diffusion facilitator CzcD-associated flavoprotein CzcO
MFTNMAVPEPTEQAEVTSCDVLIVGAGFSGVYGVHKFRQLGLTVKVFEAGGDLGGVWHWNRYPGARVDSEWPYYQLRIPEVWKDFNFSERFPTHDEVRRYFAHADKVLELKKDIQFNARVNLATWDNINSRWTVRTEGGHVAVCKYLCLCTGVLHRQYLPDFPGIENFKGQIYHSAAWPNDVDVSGKRVGLVGAGATAVQIVQELSKLASHLTMFMRQPNICLPMNNRPINDKEHASWRTFLPLLFDAGRKSNSGFPVPPPRCGIFDLTDKARDEWYEQMWNAGAFHFVSGNFPDVYTDKKANRIAYDFWAKKTRARIANPLKRDLIAPLEPPYPIFTRRYPLEHDYYESLDRDNVDIVSLRKFPIKTFTNTGVLTSDGAHRELDYVIFATGFDGFTGS